MRQKVETACVNAPLRFVKPCSEFESGDKEEDKVECTPYLVKFDKIASD